MFKCTCDCGQKCEVVNLEDVVDFFEAHGHFASLLTVKCAVCGATHKTGPQEGLPPFVRAARDIRWEEQHAHVGAAA